MPCRRQELAMWLVAEEKRERERERERTLFGKNEVWEMGKKCGTGLSDNLVINKRSRACSQHSTCARADSPRLDRGVILQSIHPRLLYIY